MPRWPLIAGVCVAAGLVAWVSVQYARDPRVLDAFVSIAADAVAAATNTTPSVAAPSAVTTQLAVSGTATGPPRVDVALTGLRPVNPLLRPGRYAATAAQTFVRRLWTSERLHELAPAELCARRYIVTELPNAAWGNTLSRISLAHFIGLLTNRTVIYERNSTRLLHTHLPFLGDVRSLRQRNGCVDADVGKVLTFPRVTEQALHPGLLEANATFIQLKDVHSWRWAQGTRELVLAASLPPDVTELLLHPAFTGIAQIHSYSLLPAVEQLMDEFVRPLRSRTPVAAQVRHRIMNIDLSVTKCLHLVAPNRTVSVFVATDRPDVTGEQLRRLPVELIMLDYTSQRGLRPALTAEIDAHSNSARSAWGTPGKEGWWGSDPSGAALVELFALAAVAPTTLIGTGMSTFSEVAMGLMLTFTDLGPDEFKLLMATPSAKGNCVVVSPERFWQRGLTV